MRRFNSSALRNLGATAMIAGAAGFAVSVANASSLTLSQLNGGPSASSVPTGDDSTVATFTFPREVVDTTVTDVPSGTLNGTAGANSSLTVQTTGGAGFRNRGRVVVRLSGFNSNAAMQLIANSNGDGVAASSFILVARSADLGLYGTSISSLMTYLDTTNPGGDGTDYFRIPFDDAALTAIDTDGEIEESDLNAGVNVPLSQFRDAIPPSGRSDPAFDIFLFAIDTGGSTDPEVVTEWGCIDRTGNDGLAQAQLATTGTSTTTIEDIRILANRQLVDDSGDTNADTVEGSLSAADDFLVATNSAGAGAQTLAAFLNGLAGGPYTIASFSIDGTSDGDFNRIITMDVNPDITDAGAITTLRSRFIAFTPAAPDGAGEVFLFNGSNPFPGAFTQMTVAGDIEVDSVDLLQGSGPDYTGNDFEIWAALDLSGVPSNAGGADPAQFQLWATDAGGNDVLVATGVTVQSAAPSNVEVIGIDDENLDGTADDAVIGAASNRVFVRFVLDDGDDRVHSDGTWSNDGGSDFASMANRFALRLEIDETQTPLLGNALGETIAADSEVTLGTSARPIPAAFRTRASTADLCQFVGALDIVFDTGVATPTVGQMRVAYTPGVTISDLTTGLDSGLVIPTIDTADAANFAAQILTLTGGTVATNFVTNDSFRFIAPSVPVDGTANNGATSIAPGTGDAPYILGLNVNAARGAGSNLGNTAVGTFDGVTGGAFTAPAANSEASDGAAPALIGATGTGSPIDEVLLGFSENVFNPTGADEAESFVFFTQDGVRLDIGGADIDFFGSNVVRVEDISIDSEVETQVAVFNPGFPIVDSVDNRIDPVVAKTKFVTIVPPAAVFKDSGVAFVDDDNFVTMIVLKTTGQVELDGTVANFLNRLYVRGDDFGSDFGEFDSFAGLVDDIVIGTEERADGCFLFTITLVDDCPLPQEDFFVQYSASNDQAAPANATLVDASNGSEVPSEVILVSVARPSTPSPEGNPIGETYVGALDLGAATEDSLGSEISAYVFEPISSCGAVRFVYKGVVYTGEVAGLSGSDTLVADGTVFYFHPQLKGNGSCSGMLSPCGIINSKPDVDLYQVAELSSTTSGNGGINDAGGATVISTESQVLLYQNLDPALVIRPIQMTVRRDTTTPGRFTVTGPGISNGSITFQGRFRHIGTTYVTGDADSNGARPYTLHTRGEKHFLGLPVVFVVVPDSNFSDVSPFLANNLLARRVTFAADNQADVTTAGKNFTFAANAPIVFNINADNVWEYPLSGLEQDDWAFLPASATSPTRANVGGPGQDFGTAANQPNRLLVPGAAPNTTTPANAVTAFPPNTTARGFFVMLDTFTNEPVILDMVTALALDTRGVYCGAVRGLNRIATGYAYAIEFASGTNYGRYSWFTFGTLVEDINAASLAVTPNGSNGGWHLLNNGSGNDITASTASIGGNQIFMSMDSAEGVRIFIEGQPQFSDFESVAPNHGYLLFTDMAISNFR